MFGKIKLIRKIIKWSWIIGAVTIFFLGIGTVFFLDGLGSDDGSSSGSTSSSVTNISDEQIKAMYDEFEKNKGTQYIMDHSNLSYDKCMDYYDCSSWVIHCLAHSGVKKLPDLTAAGIYTYCEKVEIDDRKAGDLIFLQHTYNCDDTVSHVGIYLGKFSIDGEEAEWIIDTGGNDTGGVKISKYGNRLVEWLTLLCFWKTKGLKKSNRLIF